MQVILTYTIRNGFPVICIQGLEVQPGICRTCQAPNPGLENLIRRIMKNIFILFFLGCSFFASAQVITEDQLTTMVKEDQEKCEGAHSSIVLRVNEDFAESIWGKTIRFNNADIIRFFNHPSGEKVYAGVGILNGNKNKWSFEYDQQTASNLLTKNGVRVTKSYNTQWIIARQDLLYAESNTGPQKTILELYCPKQELLEVLRIGKQQSIEFLITGYAGSVSSSNKIYGILTKVFTVKQVVTCVNGHEYDKSLGYKFCPVCGEPLKEPEE